MTRSVLPQPSAHRAGFTLVELLTVIAIILVLAGLLLNVAGNANYKSSVARATSEVKAIETACESYKADNGTYPRNGDTDNLNAQLTNTPPDPSTYAPVGRYLYQCLSGLPASGSTYNKTYMDFKSGQLSTGTAAPSAGSTGTYLVDPFGLSYGYSTANQADSTKGYNPTFDLWSTAGYATSGGKKYPTGANTGTAATNLWVKNW